MKITQEVFIKMVLDAWYTQINRTDDLVNSLPDEKLQQRVALGKNNGVYLLGHLAAVHDKMQPLLALGETLHPEWYELFVTQPYNPAAKVPAISEIKRYWKKINAALAEKFAAMSSAQWFEKHNAVSAEDFIAEPHRNKLNVIINRTNHLEYHRGQLILLKD